METGNNISNVNIAAGISVVNSSNKQAELALDVIKKSAETGNSVAQTPDQPPDESAITGKGQFINVKI